MISDYPSTPPESIYAYLLVASVIERARIDTTHHNDQHQKCVATFVDHPARVCARIFLEKLDSYRALHPEADHIEIALEVLKWLR